MKSKIIFIMLLTALMTINIAQNLSTQSPVYSKIVFSRQENQNDWDLWIMDLNGTNQTRIHNSTSNDADPHFKYDGNKIVFSRFTQGTPPTQDIYTIDPDGSNLTNLTGDIGSEVSRPKWSWDGTKIVYCLTAGIDNKDIYIMNSDGSNKTALVTGSNNEDWPSFSPDGLYIIFQRYIGAVSNQKTKICRYKISDGSITELTDGNNLDEMPFYSPDGNYILFKRGTTNAEIYRMLLSNSALENLTNNSVVDDAPAYSYDGTKIAWMQSTTGMNTAEIWIMNSDGSGKTQLTNNSVADFNPTFSPFGTAPGQVTLLSPANNSINQPLTLNLSWNPVASAATYELQVSQDQSFPIQLIMIYEQGITATNKTITLLINNAKYYWRVRAVNSFGNGPWSDPFNFTTVLELPHKVTLVSPSNNATLNNNNVTLVWFASTPQVDNYWLEIADNINFANSVIDQNITTISKEFTALPNKSYWWKVKAHNATGWGEFSDVWKFNSMTVDVKEESLPTKTELFQNYPNPFNAGTEISFNIAEQSFVTLKIFNLLGNEIEVPINKNYNPGNYKFYWNPITLPSGIYFYQIQAGKYSQVKKMILIK